MIDFIFAGVIYLSIMLVISFFLSFVTIGITYTLTLFVKRVSHWIRQPRLAYK
jgi:hypothetical protein